MALRSPETTRTWRRLRYDGLGVIDISNPLAPTRPCVSGRAGDCSGRRRVGTFGVQRLTRSGCGIADHPMSVVPGFRRRSVVHRVPATRWAVAVSGAYAYVAGLLRRPPCRGCERSHGAPAGGQRLCFRRGCGGAGGLVWRRQAPMSGLEVFDVSDPSSPVEHRIAGGSASRHRGRRRG